LRSTFDTVAGVQPARRATSLSVGMVVQYVGLFLKICVRHEGTAPLIAQTARFRRRCRPLIARGQFFSAEQIKRLISDFEPIKSRRRSNGEHFVKRRPKIVR
jgi:hypothetical protein